MSKRDVLNKRLYEELVKTGEVYGVEVAEGKSCMGLYEAIVEKYDRKECIQSLELAGRTSNSILREMNNIVRKRLKRLESEENSRSVLKEASCGNF